MNTSICLKATLLLLVLSATSFAQSKSVDVRDAVSDIVQVVRREWKIDGYFECKKAPELEVCRAWVELFTAIHTAQDQADRKAKNNRDCKDRGYDCARVGAKTFVTWEREAQEAADAVRDAVEAVKDARSRLVPKIENPKSRSEIERSLADIEFSFRSK